MLFLLVLLVKQILDKPLSHLFSVRLWVHSSYDEFFGQWWHMGYISWAGCLTLPCWYERSGSGSSSCGTSEECFPCAEENIKIHFCGIAVRSFSHFLNTRIFNCYFDLINLCFIKSKTSHTASHNVSIYEDFRGDENFLMPKKVILLWNRQLSLICVGRTISKIAKIVKGVDYNIFDYILFVCLFVVCDSEAKNNLQKQFKISRNW